MNTLTAGQHHGEKDAAGKVRKFCTRDGGEGCPERANSDKWMSLKCLKFTRGSGRQGWPWDTKARKSFVAVRWNVPRWRTSTMSTASLFRSCRFGQPMKYCRLAHIVRQARSGVSQTPVGSGSLAPAPLSRSNCTQGRKAEYGSSTMHSGITGSRRETTLRRRSLSARRRWHRELVNGNDVGDPGGASLWWRAQ